MVVVVVVVVVGSLQCGGEPTWPAAQEHATMLPRARHVENGPQGLGVQGSRGTGEQPSLASPSWPSWHRHTASCCTTEHTELAPHDTLGHGSTHLLLKTPFFTVKILRFLNFLPDTGLVVGTIGVLGALSAAGRGAQEALLALAHGLVAGHPALGVWPAGGGGAGVRALGTKQGSSDMNIKSRQ